MLKAIIATSTVLLLVGCSPAGEPGVLDGTRTTDADMSAIADCLRDRGWDAVVIDGAVSVAVTEERADDYEEDVAECYQEIGVDTDSGLTPEQLVAVFDWYREIARCLEGAGWDVPEQPSLEVFHATYDSDPWIPWEFVEGKDLGRARELCPVIDEAP